MACSICICETVFRVLIGVCAGIIGSAGVDKERSVHCASSSGLVGMAAVYLSSHTVLYCSCTPFAAAMTCYCKTS
ncbi:hypothetical protein BJV82DRAFT_634950 [Fennellomyces sp. T-0311]|nr:hypothetical protein BJV82DRAFT_634950 [Fennellomyces sp. T-0311]